ncbi:hypothetical protein V5P93_005709 [Actinokineospora auranticolor]|uniref:Uncharacterized protein n=1 Tax=Actinokineospora auranticolor TaxID=155976 RepID=A0A2S6GFB6_9PSEU|nr:hypothetical protein [Actinokineospora auranticolor]PPK63836.1 hypothetical protein CLV40_12480 [Actinokineospora auranticolor]
MPTTGKATTTEILEGRRDRDSGAVSVLGADLAWRGRAGIVLRESGDHADLTVQEVLRHFSTYHPDSRDPDEVIDAVGLGGRERALT